MTAACAALALALLTVGCGGSQEQSAPEPAAVAAPILTAKPEPTAAPTEPLPEPTAPSAPTEPDPVDTEIPAPPSEATPTAEATPTSTAGPLVVQIQPGADVDIDSDELAQDVLDTLPDDVAEQVEDVIVVPVFPTASPTEAPHDHPHPEPTPEPTAPPGTDVDDEWEELEVVEISHRPLPACLADEATIAMFEDGTWTEIRNRYWAEHHNRLTAEGYEDNDLLAELTRLAAPEIAAEIERRVDLLISEGRSC